MSANYSKVSAGVYTALITPFTESGSVDHSALERIVQYQIDSGVSGLVVNGTTAESPTLHDNERVEIIRRVVMQVSSKLPIFVGVGSNSTEKTVQAAREAEELGATGLLVVNPYYNKPTQEGLYQHFKTVASSSSLPVMLYNIKGRTAVNLDTPTLCRLFEIPSVCAVKEASGDISQMMEVIRAADLQRPDFVVLSGDDVLTLPLMALGGVGVVSVASNVIAAELVAMVRAASVGNYDLARKLHFAMLSFMNTLFCETNPVPVKFLAASLFQTTDAVRLPLVALSEVHREKVLSAFHEVRAIHERVS